MFCDSKERKAYMEQVMEGYNGENSFSDEWLNRLPMFVRLIQVEEFLQIVRYIDDHENSKTTKGAL